MAVAVSSMGCGSANRPGRGWRPELLGSPLRVTLEHEAPIALGDKLEILAHTHPAGSTDRFGAGHRQVIWELLWRSRCEWIAGER